MKMLSCFEITDATLETQETREQIEARVGWTNKKRRTCAIGRKTRNHSATVHCGIIATSDSVFVQLSHNAPGLPNLRRVLPGFVQCLSCVADVIM